MIRDQVIDVFGLHTLRQDATSRKLCVFLACTGVLVPLAYVLWTNHVWEDYLITFRHSRNLVEGNGLVYQPGERVHGFTSPLNVLIPALFYWLADSTDYMPALWMFRWLSIVLFTLGGLVLLAVMMSDNRSRPLSGLLFCLFYAFEAKSVIFSVNGQEAAFMLFFLAVALSSGYRGLARYWMIGGLSWGGLMWSRPDGCVYVAALALAGLVFAEKDRKQELKGILKAAAVCTVVYGPWFLWAWSYYGSPVPHTFLAKLSWQPAESDLLNSLLRTFSSYPIRTATVFSPIYYSDFGGWPRWVAYFHAFCGIFCTVYWFLRTGDRLGRFASLCFILGCLYLAFLGNAAPWYKPPVAMLGVIVMARGISGLGGTSIRSAGGVGAAAVGTVIFLAMLQIFIWITAQMRVQQEEIELGNRAKIGQWLKQHTQEGDTIFLECLGYIGYYSYRHMLDVPGMASPSVVRVAREKKTTHFGVLIWELEPDWLVLRPWEAKQVFSHEGLKNRYSPQAHFSAKERLARYKHLKGMPYLEYDAEFYVFKKKD